MSGHPSVLVKYVKRCGGATGAEDRFAGNAVKGSDLTLAVCGRGVEVGDVAETDIVDLCLEGG